MNEEVRELSQLSFDAVRNEDMNVSVKVFFVDLADYRDSLSLLYELVYRN